MVSLPVLTTLFREAVTRERSPRVPEPDLVMDDPEKVAAFTRAGREDGVMAPMYLFHCAQVCEVIRPGDKVVDLACGPATQLGMIARLNPDTRFLGIDFSDEMLDRARTYVVDQGIGNIELRKGNISELGFLDDGSVDAVMSTMSLHHLPNVARLNQTFAHVGRILAPGGGVYLADFGHLKSERSISYFGNQYADRQPELFTLDYIYSLRAAFSREDFGAACTAYLEGRARVYATFLAPFLVVVKSPGRNPDLSAVRPGITALRDALPRHHRTDINDLIGWFRPAGLKAPLLK